MKITSCLANSIKWEVSGNNFSGINKEINNLIGGLLTIEHPETGAIFALNYEWLILNANATRLYTVIQVFYQFTNENQQPDLEQLYALTKDSAQTATDFLNKEINSYLLNLSPRETPVTDLDGWTKSILEGIMLKAYPKS